MNKQNTSSRSSTKKRNILSLDLIISTALEIVDKDGLSGLSMRRIGQQLSVSAGALYPYIESKENLTQALIDAMFKEVDLEIFDCDKWQVALRAMGQELQRIFLKHKDLVSLTLGRIPTGPNFALVLEKMMESLSKNGIPVYLGFYAGDIIGLYTAASVYEKYLQQSGINETPTGEANVSAFRAFLTALPEEKFPNIHKATLEPFNTQIDRFQLGLDIVILGLERTFENQAKLDI